MRRSMYFALFAFNIFAAFPSAGCVVRREPPREVRREDKRENHEEKKEEHHEEKHEERHDDHR
jgi:hypothetical protein